MDGRTGAKIGWIAGWFGGFLWVAVLAIVFLAKGKPLAAAVGLCLAISATVFIFLFAPWKRPRTRYWKLMLPLYAAMAASVPWAVFSFGLDSIRQGGLSWWSLALVLPLLTPVGTMGRRRWCDYEQQRDAQDRDDESQ